VSENSGIGTLGTIFLGGVVGFGLFFVVTGLGGQGGRGTPLLSQRPRFRPQDDKRLSFVMVEPKVAGGLMGFRLRDGEPSKIYALEELISRIKEGGRTDVELRASGDVPHGSWEEARALIKRAGVTVWLAESAAAPVSAGSWGSRGEYSRRSW